MQYLCLTHFVFLVIGQLFQVFITDSLIRRVKQYRLGKRNDFTPRVSVLMAVRGHDPSLDSCLTGLLDLDYPDYHIVAIVDSLDDPACRPLADFQKRCPAGQLDTIVVSRQRTTCGGKANALIEGISQRNDDSDIIAIIDSDATPPCNWLRDLISPLADKHVGLVTGNRWFEPQPGSFGSAVRSAWNIGALVYMDVADVPWGGSLAFRRSALNDNGILDAWEQVFSDDAPLRDLTIEAGQTMARVPNLLLINRETCRTSELPEWTQRQLLSVWCFLKRRWQLVGPGIYFFVLLISLPCLAAFAIARGDTTALILLAADATFGIAVLLGLGIWLEKNMRSALESNGEKARTLGWTLLPASLTAFAIHCFGCVSIVFRRRFSWRGRMYVVHGSRSVEVQVPPVPTPKLVVPGESLLR